MAFLDDISKKLSAAGGDVISRGKAFADITRLNSNISEEEKKINNTYFQIGKLYVSLHPQDYETDFAALIETIVASENKITTLKQQIQDVKGVIRCEKCGAEVQKSMAFCSACGAPMPKKEPTLDENHIHCEACGAVIDKNLRFCTSCGKPLVKPTQIETQPDAPVFNKKVCPSCGTTIQEGMKFCTTCGYKISAPADENNAASQDSVISDPQRRTCPACGAEIDFDVAFCTECGTPLN